MTNSWIGRRVFGGLFALGIGAGVLHCSADSPPTEPKAADAQAACDVVGETVVKTVNAEIGSDRVVVTSTSNPASTSVSQTISVTLDGKAAFRSESTVTGAYVKTVAHYSKPFVPDDTDIVFEIVGGKAQGTIAGKRLMPIDIEAAKKDPSAIKPTYLDGTAVTPIAAYGVDARVGALIGKAMGTTSSGEGKCGEAAPSIGTKAEPGHVSSPGASEECRNCNRVCVLKYVGCLFLGNVSCLGCFGLVSIPFVGAGLAAACYAICNAVVVVGCSVDYASCRDSCSGKCCPVKCGDRCCNSGESCLQPSTGLCCSEGFRACPGPRPQCADPSKEETCLPSGEACPAQKVCGNTCCPPANGILNDTICFDPTFGICCDRHAVLCKKPDIIGPGAAVCCRAGACIGGECFDPL